MKNKNPLYKYCTLSNAKKMVENETIYLGSLSEYRNEERYGPDIGDTEEGTSDVFEHLDGPHNQITPFAQKFIQVESQNANVTIKDSMFSGTITSPERYVYCVSDVFSVWLMRKFSQSQKAHYNACVKINDVDKFIDKISSSLENRAKFFTAGKCIYQRRKQNSRSDIIDPALLKNQKYECQMEARFLWTPKDEGEKDGFVLNVPALSESCELYFIDDDWHDKPPICEDFQMVDDKVLLDYTNYKDCSFKNCNFRYSGFGGFHFEQCDFNQINEMELSNGAYRTLECLKCLYKTGIPAWQNMIDQYITQIRTDQMGGKSQGK